MVIIVCGPLNPIPWPYIFVFVAADRSFSLELNETKHRRSKVIKTISMLKVKSNEKREKKTSKNSLTCIHNDGNINPLSISNLLSSLYFLWLYFVLFH